MSDDTQRFYNQEAARYPEIRARPIQRYTDRLEMGALSPFLSQASRVLDLGCGEGRLARAIFEQYSHTDTPYLVHGLDYSERMIAQARRSSSQYPALQWSVGDAARLPFADGSFDLVVSATAPNNFPDLPRAITEIHRVLRPGGVLFTTIINRHEAARLARGLYYLPYFVWRALQRTWQPRSNYMRRLYSRSELRDMLEQRFDISLLTGLRIIPDFVPEYPLNFWPSMYPWLERFLDRTEALDRELSNHPRYSRYARFHLVAARALK